MAKFCLSLIFVLFLASVKTESSNDDDMQALENDLKKIGEKRGVKATITDKEASKLLDELKKEVLNDAYVDLKNRFDSILKNKESKMLAEEKSDIEKQSDEASNEEFFKALEARADDTKDDPEAEKLIDLMANDLLTKDIKDASSDDIQKRSSACVDNRNDCENLKNDGYCQTNKEKMKEMCKKTCNMCQCVDKINHCKFLAQRGQCHSDKRVTSWCPKSCGFCKVPSPPKCSSTNFGCCWDKQTTKTDEKGSNCPDCNDKYKVCKTFKEDCGKLTSAGLFMIRNCPKTCGICGAKLCKNDPQKDFYCPFWKNDLNWCERRPEEMRHYCPKTCGFC